MTYTSWTALAPAGSDSVKANVCDKPLPVAGLTDDTDGCGLNVVIAVESVAVTAVAPPPETVTELICGDAAFPATLTVTVSAG